jgi:primosomal replication protein N
VNQLCLVASIAERETLRYTPAGIPIVTASLLHSSTQMEAGFARQVEFEIAALAAGPISGAFNQLPLGASCQFTGFMAKRFRNSRSLVFHITGIEHKPDPVIADTGANHGIR